MAWHLINNSLTQTQFQPFFYLPEWFSHCSWYWPPGPPLPEAQSTLKIWGSFCQYFLVAHLLLSPLGHWKRQGHSSLGCLVSPKTVRWHPTSTAWVHGASPVLPATQQITSAEDVTLEIKYPQISFLLQKSARSHWHCIKQELWKCNKVSSSTSGWI